MAHLLLESDDDDILDNLDEAELAREERELARLEAEIASLEKGGEVMYYILRTLVVRLTFPLSLE